MTKGLVCGPTDKNNGELWMACPALYQQAVQKMYAVGKGDYEEVFPRKMTAHRASKLQGEELLSATKETAKQKQKKAQGSASDIIKAWKTYYKRKERVG